MGEPQVASMPATGNAGERSLALLATCQIDKLERTVGADGKSRPARRAAIVAKNGAEARKARKVLQSVPLRCLPDHLIDARQATKAGRQYRLDHPPEVPAERYLATAK